MKKIKTIKELIEIVARLKKKGKTVGLVTGCFDVLHIGHIELFRFAKKKVNYLVVGVDSDESVKLSKGENHPLFDQKTRMNVLAEQESVDYVFPIESSFKFSTQQANLKWREIIKELSPTAIITCVSADSAWKRKKLSAIALGVRFIEDKRDRQSLRSSSKIIEFLKKEL